MKKTFVIGQIFRSRFGCLSPPQNSKILQLKLIRKYPQVYNGGISLGQKLVTNNFGNGNFMRPMQRLSMHSTQSALIYFLLSFGVGWGTGEDFFSFFLCSQHVSFPFPMGHLSFGGNSGAHLVLSASNIHWHFWRLITLEFWQSELENWATMDLIPTHHWKYHGLYISLHDVTNMNCWESKMFQKMV
jgi:hypothetical protein